MSKRTVSVSSAEKVASALSGSDASNATGIGGSAEPKSPERKAGSSFPDGSPAMLRMSPVTLANVIPNWGGAVLGVRMESARVESSDHAPE